MVVERLTRGVLERQALTVSRLVEADFQRVVTRWQFWIELELVGIDDAVAGVPNRRRIPTIPWWGVRLGDNVAVPVQQVNEHGVIGRRPRAGGPVERQGQLLTGRYLGRRDVIAEKIDSVRPGRGMWVLDPRRRRRAAVHLDPSQLDLRSGLSSESIEYR